MHITDRTNKLTFLVDTGAQISVLPPTRSDRLRKQEGYTLSAVNGTAIATYGTRSLTLNLGLRRTFRWIFIIADVSKPLLGADFLHHFGLLVDIAHGKLVDTNTHLSIHGILAKDTLDFTHYHHLHSFSRARVLIATLGVSRTHSDPQLS